MRSVLPDLTLDEKMSRRAAVVESQKGGDEMYWAYDHLPLAMWQGNMSEENHTKYDAVFEMAEPYVHLLCTFMR